MGPPWLKAYSALNQNIDRNISVTHPSLDILIPTLNEGGQIAGCLESIRRAFSRVESADRDTVRVVIADGGSEDDTITIAKQYGALILENLPRGRGYQLHHGCSACSAEILLMLHADVRVAEDGLARLFDVFRESADTPWGIMGGRFDHRTRRMRLLELLNRARFSLTGIAFGDQGIFVRRECLEEAGGLPAIPLMEDVELSMRLSRFRHRVHVGSALEVSSRRWEERPFLRSFMQVVKICTEYMVRRRLGADIHELSERMYREYYGEPCGTSC